MSRIVAGTRVLAIDPGPEQSAILIYDGERVEVLGIAPNQVISSHLRGLAQRGWDGLDLAVERIACYGMPVGEDVFATVRWCGRFEECWQPGPVYWVLRREVKAHLCGNLNAKDANVRQALLDRFGPGRQKALGTKRAPGPLYGVAKDLWAALGVALTFWETKRDSTAVLAGKGGER